MTWFKNKVELPFETVFEVVTEDDKVGVGIAVADIKKSEPHYHERTLEQYVLVRGALTVYIDGKPHEMTEPGQMLEIPIRGVHYAVSRGGELARVVVTTIPPWSPDDHHLVEADANNPA